jgi:hypothetical protein
LFRFLLLMRRVVAERPVFRSRDAHVLAAMLRECFGAMRGSDPEVGETSIKLFSNQ